MIITDNRLGDLWEMRLADWEGHRVEGKGCRRKDREDVYGNGRWKEGRKEPG